MRLTTATRPLFDHIATAHVAAAEDTLRDVKANQARRTGRLADSERLVGSAVVGGRARISIASDVVYADAVERGANARAKASVKAGTKLRKGQSGPVRNRASRKGPHMKGNHVVADNGPGFIEHMTQRLRGAL
jgi:hypothetical protein